MRAFYVMDCSDISDVLDGLFWGDGMGSPVRVVGVVFEGPCDAVGRCFGGCFAVWFRGAGAIGELPLQRSGVLNDREAVLFELRFWRI